MTAKGSSLHELAEQYRNAKGAFDTARAALIAKIRAEYAGGMRQADIVREIDHTWVAEHVRKLLLKKGPEQD